MRKKIQDVYKTIEPDSEAKERMLKNILSAASNKNSTESNRVKFKAKNVIHIAAAFALILIVPTVAYATNFFGLRDMNIARRTLENPSAEDSSKDEREVDIISLQGLSGTPEYKASAEWDEFCQGYDTDGSILSSVGNAQPGSLGFNEDYQMFYNCYSQEMVDKVDEICEKYQLSKLKGRTFAENYEILCSQTRIGNICKGSSENVENNYSWGYFYSDGTLLFEGKLRSEKPSTYEVGYQFVRSMKGSFSPMVLNIENIEDYEQWNYTTKNGVSLLLANSSYKALIIAEMEKSFIVVNLLSYDLDSLNISNENLEELAEAFEFSVIP